MPRNRKKQPFLFSTVPPKEKENSCADFIIQQLVNINKVLFKPSCLNSYVSSPDWFLCLYKMSPSFFFLEVPKESYPKVSPTLFFCFPGSPVLLLTCHKEFSLSLLAPVNGSLHKTSECIRRWKECLAPQIQACFHSFNK